MLSLFITSVSVKYDAQATLEKQLMQIGEQEIRLLSDRTFVDLAKVCMAEAMHSPHRINEALAEVANRDGDLCSWITAAKADNRLQVLDPEFAANQFFALIKGFCFWPQVVQGYPFPSTEQQQQILSSAVSMFLSQYSQSY
jgi:TetR/AcrR family transcriptional regulator of autoinduction and epiphytic fitness